MSAYDEALFYWRCDGKCQGLIAVHVDDFFWSGSAKFENNEINRLRSIFKIGNKEEKVFKYIGIEVHHNKEVTEIGQNTYVAGIYPIKLSDISKKKEKHELADEKEQIEFRALCGQLIWVASQTCPDVAFDVCELSTKYGKVTYDDIHKANKVVKRLKDEQVSLKYSFKGDLKEAKLLTFCDASFANLPNGGSQEGIIVFLGDGNGNVLPLSWSSR